MSRRKKKFEPNQVDIDAAREVVKQMPECDDPLDSVLGWQDNLLPCQLSQKQIGILERGIGKDWFENYRLTNDDLQSVVFEPP